MFFHKNQKQKPSGHEIYNLFKPFCDTKIGEVSTCKDIFGMRCLYHDRDQRIARPYLDEGTMLVKRDTYGNEEQHKFSKYDADVDGDNFAYPINQKSFVCNVCVKGIRQFLKTEGKNLFLRKMKHVLEETGEVDYRTYSTPPIFTACVSDNFLQQLLEDVDKFLFQGNFEFGDESVLPAPRPINYFLYRAKTYKCDTCQSVLDNCECKSDHGISTFCYKRDELFQREARNLKTSELMGKQFKKRLKRKRVQKKNLEDNFNKLSSGKNSLKHVCLNIKSKNDWKKDTLWYIGMATYCDFFSTIPATKLSPQDKKMDCDSVCKKLLTMTDEIDETNFVDVKNLLLAYRIMNREFDRACQNCTATDCQNFTATEKKEKMYEWLRSKFEYEEDNMI